MEDPRVLHRRAGALAAEVIGRIPAETYGDPTPCSEWRVRDLINHMVNGNLRAAALIAGQPGPDRDADVLGADALADYRSSFSRLCEAFDRDGVMEQIYQTPFGEGPGLVVVSMRVGDTTLHTWDLAAATGQPRDLDADLIAFCDATLRSRPLPRGGQGPFGAEQAIPDGASPADRLAAFAGRQIPA